jgi:hypothetical protein
MKRAVWWTLVFALPMEFQINVILQGSLAQFAGAAALYALIGCVMHRTFPWIARRFADPAFGFWAALTAHGLVGLLVIEWGFMGHAPGSIPDAALSVIAQAGMFAWWSTIAAMPRLLEHPLSAPWRRSIAWLYGSYALLSTAMAVVWGLAPVILMMPPAYCAFFWFYWRFGRALRTATARQSSGGTVS